MLRNGTCIRTDIGSIEKAKRRKWQNR